MSYGLMLPPGVIIAMAEARRTQRQHEDRFLSLPLPDYREPSPGYRAAGPDDDGSDDRSLT